MCRRRRSNKGLVTQFLCTSRSGSETNAPTGDPTTFTTTESCKTHITRSTTFVKQESLLEFPNNRFQVLNTFLFGSKYLTVTLDNGLWTLEIDFPNTTLKRPGFLFIERFHAHKSVPLVTRCYFTRTCRF